MGVHFVGSVYIDVDGLDLVKSHERNAEPRSQIRRLLRRRHSPHTQAGFYALGKEFNECRGGVSGAEADDIAIGDHIQGTGGGGAKTEMFHSRIIGRE